jgi:hypothetical protein
MTKGKQKKRWGKGKREQDAWNGTTFINLPKSLQTYLAFAQTRIEPLVFFFPSK